MKATNDLKKIKFLSEIRKSIFKLAVMLCLSGGILTSCSTPAEKLEDARTNSIEAEDDLDQANEDYLNDIETYKQETAQKIEANNKSIIDFNARMKAQKSEAKAEYKAKIAELEQKNTDMKKTMEDYQAEGKEKWEIFKVKFSQDMDELAASLKSMVSPAK